MSSVVVDTHTIVWYFLKSPTGKTETAIASLTPFALSNVAQLV